jgi:hypothetical protein
MRLLRKTLAAALTVAMLFVAFSGVASAAPEDGSGVAIQLNGELMDFPSGVEPYFDTETSRVFVPVRDVFSRLGAEVEYDDATRLITLTRGDITVLFPQDSKTIEITNGETTTTLESDVLPKTINNRVLVPLRFVANSLGCNVGWDQAVRTAIVVDPVSYLAAGEETFDILAKAGEIQSEGNYKSFESIKGVVTDPASGMSVDIDFALESVSSRTAADISLSGAVSLPSSVLGSLLSGAEPETPPSDGESGTPTSVDMPIDAEIIYNTETGLFAFNLGVLGMFLGQSAETWITGDLNALLSEQGVDLDSLADGQAQMDIRSLLDEMMAQFILALDEPTSVDDFELVSTVRDMLYGMLGDSGFERTGDEYVNAYSFTYDGQELNSEIRLATDADGNAVSVSMTAKTTIAGETFTDVSLTASAEKSEISIKVKFSNDVMGIDITVTSETSPTDEQPRAELPEDAATVDISELGLDQMIPGVAR